MMVVLTIVSQSDLLLSSGGEKGAQWWAAGENLGEELNVRVCQNPSLLPQPGSATYGGGAVQLIRNKSLPDPDCRLFSMRYTPLQCGVEK